MPLRRWIVLLAPLLFYFWLTTIDMRRLWSVPDATIAGIAGWTITAFVHLLLILLRVPRAITVTRDSLTARYTLWRRTVRLSAVARPQIVRDYVRISIPGAQRFALPNLTSATQFGAFSLFDALLAVCDQLHDAQADPARPPGSRREKSTSPRSIFSPLAVAALIVIGLGLTWSDRYLPSINSLRPDPPPDLTRLSAYPRVAAGWTGAPTPILPGLSRDARWNVDFATGQFIHNQTDIYI